MERVKRFQRIHVYRWHRAAWRDERGQGRLEAANEAVCN